MKRRLIWIGLVVAGIALAIFLSQDWQSIVALCPRDLEIVFIVTDEQSGKPLQYAGIDLMVDDGRQKDDKMRVIKLLTDGDGRAKFVHENNWCDDYIRPFRKTLTEIDLTWASINVSAKGYSPIEKMWLHDAKYENLGTFSDARIQRVVFNLALQKRPAN